MSPLPLHRALAMPRTNTTFNLFSYFDTIRDTGIWSLIDRWLIRNTHNHNKTRDNALQTFSSASSSQYLRWPATQLRREVRCVCFGWSSLPCTTFKGRYLVESLVFSYSPSSPTPGLGTTPQCRGQDRAIFIPGYCNIILPNISLATLIKSSQSRQGC